MINFGYRDKFHDIASQNDKRPKYTVREMAEVLKINHNGLVALIARTEKKPTPISYKTMCGGKKTALYDKKEFAEWFASTGAKIKAAKGV